MSYSEKPNTSSCPLCKSKLESYGNGYSCIKCHNWFYEENLKTGIPYTIPNNKLERS